MNFSILTVSFSMTKLWKLKAGRKKTDRFAYIKKKKAFTWKKTKQNKKHITRSEIKRQVTK